MKNSKDSRIKKLKKKRIWPSILGLFVIVIVFTVLLIILIACSVQDVGKRKILTSIGQTEPIVELFEGYEENKESIQESVMTYIDMVPETEAVWVSDLEGNKVWANSDKVPDVASVDEVCFSDEESVELIIHDSSSEIAVDDDGNLYFNGDFFDETKLDAIIDSGFYGNEELVQVQVWHFQEIDGLRVYVLQNVIIYAQDCFMLVMSAGLFGIMIAIFVLYYLSSFVSVIISMRRTSKVLYMDVITGGNNWLYFEKKGNKLLKGQLSLRNYAVIHFKMRKYRSFCTCFGVSEGEILVEHFYQVMKKKVKRNELVVYKDNATFGLLLAYTDDKQLSDRLEALMVDLDAVLPKMRLYFAAGVYKVNKRDRDIEQLYNNAVLACDMLGEEAENKIIFYDIEMNKRRLWERKVEDDMYAALANHEFQVYLQPKISTNKEVLAGAEALVRWIHPKEGFIPPNKFIPIFEKNGFILKLDDYMLEEIAKQQAQWIEQGRKVVPISVNVSRAHFAKEDLAEHICSIVNKYKVPHNVIELELTESAFFDDKEVLLNTVKKLREAGFIVSMDDFGAGYSSLNSLKELQLDVLKLDADFFRGVEAQERGMLIVSEVIDLAKKLDMKIVAEGIESREQVDFLTEQECDLIQGYFYAKPMPVSEFEEKYSAE